MSTDDSAPFLDKDLVEAARRKPGLIGRELLVFQEVTSTNDTAWDLAARGCQPGLVVCAKTQRSGRGQFERTWESASGKGLWFSILIDLPKIFSDTSLLTCWVTAALAPALTAVTKLPLRIKAPNDLYVHNKKLGGILVETRSSKATPQQRQAVLGIGINVHQQHKDFSEILQQTATSVTIACAEDALAKKNVPSMETILATLLDALEDSRNLLQENPDLLKTRYQKLLQPTALIHKNQHS